MSEEEMIDAIVDKIEKILIMKYTPEETDGADHWAVGVKVGVQDDTKDDGFKDDTEDEVDDIFTIASVICAHLKLLLSTMIQHMTYYKKKHLFFCHKLNRKRDPRVPSKEDPTMPISKKSRTMSSVIAYENTPFTAKDFFQMLKDHEDLIPSRSFYHRYMEQLVSMDSVKPFVPKALSDDDDDDYKEAK